MDKIKNDIEELKENISNLTSVVEILIDKIEKLQNSVYVPTHIIEEKKQPENNDRPQLPLWNYNDYNDYVDNYDEEQDIIGKL